MQLTPLQATWFRLRRSGLVKPFESPEAGASALIGVQAQIVPAAGLALWNRTNGLNNQEFENLLYHKRTLVKLWGQRNTLHLYPSEEWPLIHGALSEETTWYGGEDLADHHATLIRIAEQMRDRESFSRSDLPAEALRVKKKLSNPHYLVVAGLVRYGYICHAKPVGSEGRFVHREVWLPNLDWNPPPVDEANTEVARRYLRTYGPATAQDLAYWLGTKVNNARRWLAGLEKEVVEVSLDGQSCLALREDLSILTESPPPTDSWPVRLLYRFDPLLLGMKDKTWLIDSQYYKRIWRTAGHIEATLFIHGQIGGTWRYDRKKGGVVVSVSPFVSLSSQTRKEIEKCADGVAKFFELPLVDLVIGEK